MTDGKLSLGRCLLATVSIAILLFLLLPVFITIPISFSSGSFLSYPIDGFSLRWYERIFESKSWMSSLRNSLIAGFSSAALSTIIGTLAAIGLDRFDFRGKGFAAALMIMPLAMPIVITALGLYFWLASLDFLYTYSGLIIGHTVLGAPYVLITVSANLRGFDWRLMRAAASLGASPGVATLTVILPLLAPGILAGAIFAFIASFDDVVVALFITGPAQYTFPRQLFSGLRDQLDPSIIAASTLLTAFILGIMAVGELVRLRNQRKSR